MNKKDLTYWLGIIITIVFMFVLVGGIVFACVTSSIKTATLREQIEKQLAYTSNLTVYNATMDSPLVVIKLETIDELMEVAQNSGNSVIYKIGYYKYATIVNSTIGYSYTVHVDGPFWWVW